MRTSDLNIYVLKPLLWPIHDIKRFKWASFLVLIVRDLVFGGEKDTSHLSAHLPMADKSFSINNVARSRLSTYQQVSSAKSRILQ